MQLRLKNTKPVSWSHL